MNKRIDSIVQRWLHANPVEAHSLGIHEFDGELPDYSPLGVSTRVLEIKEDITILSNIIKDEKEDFKRYEYSLIKMKLEEELFKLEELKEQKIDPSIYIRPLVLIELSYTTKDFDTVDNRLRSIVKIEESIPNFLQVALKNLRPSLARMKIIITLQFGRAVLSYLKDTLYSFAVKSDDEDLIHRWATANVRACEAIEYFLKQMEEKYLPNAHTNYRLGEKKFLDLLEITTGVRIDTETLIKMGEEDLERNYSKLMEILKRRGKDFLEKVMKDHPPPDQIIEDIKERVERIYLFLKSSNLVTVPTDAQCEVVEAPEFMNSFAAMSVPGPFEKGENSQLWITLPNTQWDNERREMYLRFMSSGFLEAVIIHEVWPGHYLQLLYSNQVQSTIVKLFARSSITVEGWAHYVEEMMVEEGYAPFDKDILHIGQLLGALVRNCRYLTAINIHCKKMTVREATKLFIEKAYMPKILAEKEAERGAVEPLYLNYTLGKLLVKKLRRDYQIEKGEEFSLKNFHDTFLLIGSPPIIVHRKFMLKNNVKELL